MSAHGPLLRSLKSGSEVWDRVERRQLEQSPEGELGKQPQNQKPPSGEDGGGMEIWDDPGCSMSLLDAS